MDLTLDGLGELTRELPRVVAGVLVRRPKTSECVSRSKLPCRADPALLGLGVAVGEGPIAKPSIGTD